MSERPIVAITLGDVNGIGPEVCLKALSKKSIRQLMRPLLVGPAEVLQEQLDILKLELSLHVISDLEKLDSDCVALPVLDLGWSREFRSALGRMSPVSGRLAVHTIEAAVDLVMAGRADALVTAPISKKAISLASYDYVGHTDLLAHRTQSDVVMVMLHDRFRVGLATSHCALSEVPSRLSRRLLVETLKILSKDLETRFALAKPRIAVTGMNPHAGELGLLGSEEMEIIGPAIEVARNLGLAVFGPFPADSLFAHVKRDHFDAYLAMYHDQGLIPVKLNAFGKAVNYTAGLPFVRTSPDHGTAFEIAGKGVADSGSMEEALKLAASLVSKSKAG